MPDGAMGRSDRFDAVSVFETTFFEQETETQNQYFDFSFENDFFNYCRNEYDNERLLYDLVLTEAYNLHGVCGNYYAVTYNTNYNRIWGEDNDRRWERRFSVMMYMDLPKEEDMWSKFGIEGIDTLILWISKRHFSEASKYDSNGKLQPELTNYTPKVGDIINTEYSNYFYEIVDVSQEEEMFHQGKHAWELTVRPYKNEDLGFQASDFPYQVSGTMPEAIHVTTATDVLDISDVIDQEKLDIIFSASENDKPIDTDQNSWW